LLTCLRLCLDRLQDCGGCWPQSRHQTPPSRNATHVFQLGCQRGGEEKRAQSSSVSAPYRRTNVSVCAGEGTPLAHSFRWGGVSRTTDSGAGAALWENGVGPPLKWGWLAQALARVELAACLRRPPLVGLWGGGGSLAGVPAGRFQRPRPLLALKSAVHFRFCAVPAYRSSHRRHAHTHPPPPLPSPADSPLLRPPRAHPSP